MLLTKIQNGHWTVVQAFTCICGHLYGGLGMPQESCVVSCKFPIIYYVISLYF